MKFRMRNSWRWLVALGAVFVPAVVTGALELPFTFKSGSAIKASEVNANFEALRAKIDSLSGPSVAPAVGTFTLGTILTDAPIRKFSQSITVPVSAGGQGTAKPQISPITIERDLGDGTPPVNLTFVQGKAVATASIVLGNLTIDLKNALITGVAVTTPGAGHPQEAISLSFASIEYTWQEPNKPARQVAYDVAKGTGGSGATQDFNYGAFPAGITPDAAYTPVTGFEHQIVVPSVGAKPQFGQFFVTKPAGVESLDTLGLVLSSKVGSTLALSVFTDETTISNGVELDDVLVSSFALSTDASGALNEQSSFSYRTITWTAGIQTAGWDVAANKGL